jgi:hypothetical protein
LAHAASLRHAPFFARVNLRMFLHSFKPQGAPPARMNGAAYRAHGTGSKNKPAQRGWAARQEKIQPKEKCFLLDSFYRTDQDLAAPPDRGVFTCARKSKAIVLMGAVKNACFGRQSAPWRKGIEL